MPIIAPSILAARFEELGQAIELINQSEANWFHVDVMDGQFVPNISFGTPIMEALQRCANKPLDVHLMIVEPDRYLQTFAELGAATITVHAEACVHLHRTLQAIKKLGIQAGVALNPHTPIEQLSECLDLIDLVCIMSVNPGFGGQSFIENTYHKVTRLRDLIGQKNTETLIEIDGGVNLTNAPKLIAAGADVLVAGSLVFGASNPKQVIHQLKECAISN